MAKKNFVKTYKGKQVVAQKAYLKDAERHARKGYVAISERWEDGSWGCGAFMIALLLCVLVVGIFVFIYLLVVKPAGTLTVTYEQRPAEVTGTTGEKACPMCAESVKLAAKLCKHCGHDFGA